MQTVYLLHCQRNYIICNDLIFMLLVADYLTVEKLLLGKEIILQRYLSEQEREVATYSSRFHHYFSV